MHHIIYMSTASWPMTDAELQELLRQAQQGNERLGITGALVYGDGQFMQIMEGEQATLETLYAHLGQDRRHKGLFKLADRPIIERRFSEWSMAFQVVSPAGFEQLVGYVAPARLTQQLPDLGAADSLFVERMRSLALAPVPE
ncbi:BLUF domain-containing protein [Hymenobacter bucti]|uniref:BLUF domain-containing protein n=1 Tax=Hymenobacter bucti TaxID=1844114 RepID=A0ABW4QTB2_9BACT